MWISISLADRTQASATPGHTHYRKMIKSVLITGCSEGGIGAALAQRFQRSPEDLVFVTARNISKINPDLAGASNVHSIALDVTLTLQLQAAVTEVAALMGGKLDILINNAGINHTTPILDTDMERTDCGSSVKSKVYHEQTLPC